MFENPTANVGALCISCTKIACCSSEVDLHISLFGQQHPKCEWAIRLVYPPFCFDATPDYRRIVSLLNPYKGGNTSGNTMKCGNTQCHCICMLPPIDGHQLPRYTASCIRRTTSSAMPLRKYQNLQVFSSTKGIQKGKFLRKIFRYLSDSAPESTTYWAKSLGHPKLAQSYF